MPPKVAITYKVAPINHTECSRPTGAASAFRLTTYRWLWPTELTFMSGETGIFGQNWAISV